MPFSINCRHDASLTIAPPLFGSAGGAQLGGGSASGRGAGRVAGAGGVEAQAVHRTGGGDEQVVAFGAAEGEVGGGLGEVQLAGQGAVGVEAVDPIVGGGPDPAGVVEPDAVEGSGVAGGEHLPGGQGTAAGDVEEPDVLGAGIGDVELAFAGGEGEPVRAQEPGGGDAGFAGLGRDAVDVAGAGLAGRLVPLIVAVDAIAGIGEPDRAAGPLHDVVGAVAALAVIAAGQHGHRAIVLGAGNLPCPVLAADQSPLPVRGVAVGSAGRCPEFRGLAGELVEPQDPVVGGAAEAEIGAGREVGGPFGPAAAGEQPLRPGVAAARPEPLVQHLQFGPDPVRHNSSHEGFNSHKV